MSICLALLGLALVRYGLPLDLATAGALLVGTGLVGLVRVGASARVRWALAAIPLLFHLHLHAPWESSHLQDVRGGREGVRLFPGLRFGRDGPNTALLERLLGPLEAEWRHQAIRSMLLIDWRDGNERVNSRSLIRRDDYSEILAMLPDDAARRQVSACLTDARNLARVHQGLLLACLKALGYPAGHDATSWWAAHAWAFARIPDPEEAAAFVHGWTHAARGFGARDATIASQLRAVEYQERGSWGGDLELGRAFYDLERAVLVDGDAAARLAAREWIVWWPEHRRPDEAR